MNPAPVAMSARARRFRSRYGLAAGLATVGIASLEAFDAAEVPEFYSPLVGAVVVAVWFAGVGPALLVVAAGWTFEFFADVSVAEGVGESRARWLTGLVVAVVIVWVTSAMRLAGTRAIARAAEARRVGSYTERLHELASGLAAAVTPGDIAGVLVDRGARVLGARGGAFGLVVGDEVEIIDSGSSERRGPRPEGRLPLAARTSLCEAIRSGELQAASTRVEIAERYPDERASSDPVGGVIAAPLRIAGRFEGAISYEFDETDLVDDERLVLAGLVADLGGEAVERARLYENERALREGLDRALQVAPRAGGGSPNDVAASVCREARRTFGADVALMLSILDEERFSIDWRDPASLLAPPGLALAISDLPDLHPAIASGQVMWVPDMLASLHGQALEIAQALGTVSALRIPIAVSGRVDRIVVLQWNKRVGDPAPELIALARRFADQAGLALEQAQRRAAEELAERRAEETRTLLDVTTALAAATTVADVVETVLHHGSLSLGADGGVVALRERDELVVVGGLGMEAQVEGARFQLSAPLPLAEAIRRNEVVAVESFSHLDRRYPPLDQVGSPLPYPASISVPLAVRGSTIGGMAFGFGRARGVDESQRHLVAAIARQASEALERARLHEAERSARGRAERAAARLAQLHALGITLARARSQGEVAEVVGRQITGVLGARSAALYVVDVTAEALRPVGRIGSHSPEAERFESVALSSDLPIAVSVRTGEVVWSMDERPPHPEEAAWAAAGAGAWGVVPMVVEGRSVGALAVSFDASADVDEDARRFVETVGRHAGQPLDRVRLLQAERIARLSAEEASLRTERLQAASEALAVAVTTAQVADTALVQALASIEADEGLLYLQSPGRDHLDIGASVGALHDRVGELARLPLAERSPVSDVVADNRLVETDSLEELGWRYPDFAARLAGAIAGAAVCVPISVGARTVGALFLSLAGRTLESADRDLLLTLGGVSGQALERARLHESEQAAALQLRRLHAITAALSGAATAEEVGRATLEEAAAAVGAGEGAVALTMSDDAVDVVAAIGATARVRGLPVHGPLAGLLRGGLPVWAHGDAAPPYPLPGGAVKGNGAWAALPLTGSTEVMGALVLGFPAKRALAPEDRTWLQAVASQCAGALERSRLYDVERETRQRVERLQSLTTRLSTALRPADVAAAVLAAGREALGADAAVLVGLGDDGVTLELLGAEGDPGEPSAGWRGLRVDEPVPVAHAMRSRQPVFLERRTDIAERYPRFATALESFGHQAWAVAPLVVADRSVAALSFAWDEERSFDAEARRFIGTLARQSAQALDRARKHESGRQIAETLQRSMLPARLPEVPGVALAARYMPGTAGMEVGGDWFDAIPLDDGRLGLAVGDVVGKGVRAASTMGQLRNALRAFALELRRPATVVSRLNALIDAFADVPFATLVYLTLDPVRRLCRYTVAGHLPPLVLSPDGAVSRLEGGRSLPLGVGPDVEFAQDVVELEPGSVILLYTDGLVERPGQSLEHGLERLEQSMRDEDAVRLDPGELADLVLARVLAEDDPRDDVAMLVVRLAPALPDREYLEPSAPTDERIGELPSGGQSPRQAQRGG